MNSHKTFSWSIVISCCLFGVACGGGTTSQVFNDVNSSVESWDTETTVSSNKLQCADGGECYVGDIGPGGGTIFFIDEDGARGRTIYEVACAGWENGCDGSEDPEVEWGCDESTGDNQPYLEQWIGLGAENTRKIIEACPSTRSAAQIVSEYSYGSTKPGDWYLPSADELDELCKYVMEADSSDVRCPGGSEPRLGFMRDHYWSSSVKDEGEYRRKQISVEFSFGNRYAGACHKMDPLLDDSPWTCVTGRLRPIRSFELSAQ